MGIWDDITDTRSKHERDQVKRRAKRKLRPKIFGGMVWSVEDTLRLMEFRKLGRSARHLLDAFPGKTISQIHNKIDQIEYNVAYRGDAHPSYVGLGLRVGQGPKPDQYAVAERDDRINAERDSQLDLDPNFVLLGDPSPQRVAAGRRIQEAKDRAGLHPMSAVPKEPMVGVPGGIAWKINIFNRNKGA